MAWQDTLRALSGPSAYSPLPGGSRPTLYHPGGGTRISTRNMYSNVSSLQSSGLGAPPRLGSTSIRLAPSVTKPPTTTTAQPPEAFSFSLPFTTKAPDQQPVGPLATAAHRANQNLVQSILEPLQQTAADIVRPEQGGINAASIAPWLYQANGLGINLLHNAFHDPVTGFVQDRFNDAMNVMKGVSDIVAPVMQAPENLLRDQSLTKRAQMYAGLITGAVSPDVAAGGAASGAFPGIPGDPIEGMRILIAKATGTTEEQQRKITAASFDLPQALKDAINADPRVAFDPGKLNKILDDPQGPGRQWTYQGGILGVAENIAPSFAFLGAEALLTGGLAGGIRAAGAASTIPGIAGATNALAKGTSIAMQINKLALISGLGQFGFTAALNATARIAGNQAALDMANQALSYHPISDNPNVQLVTSFAVNPFAAAGKLRDGIVSVGNKIDVNVGKVLGGQYAHVVGSDEAAGRLLARTYGIPEASVPAVVHDYFGNRIGLVKDHLMQLASQVVTDNLPAAERATIVSYSDPMKRAAYILNTYKQPILDVLKDPRQMADLIQRDSWIYGRNRGVYDPDIMLAVQRDFTQAKLDSYQFRNEIDAVVGYPSLVTPQASSAIRASLADQGDRLSAQWLNEQMQAHAGLRNYVNLLPDVGNGDATRADFERLMARAEADTARVLKQNPILLETGRSPVLRPSDGPTEYARALGTSEDVAASYLSGDPAANPDAIRGYLTQQADELGLTPDAIANMTPEQAWFTAADHIEKRTQPWVQAGKTVASAEQAFRSHLDHAAEAKAAGNTDEANRLLRLAAEQDKMIRDAYGALDVPFSARVSNAEAVRGTPNPALRDAARRKVDAESRLEQIQALYDGVAAKFSDAQGRALADPVRLLDYLHRAPEGNWVFDAGTAALPTSLRNKLARILPLTEDARVSITEASNRDLWNLAQKYDGRDIGGKRFALSATERRALTNTRPTLDRSIEDFMPRDYVGTEDTLLAELARAREQRDALLGPYPSEARLRQAHTQRVPQTYVDAARSDLTLTHDYVYETSGLQMRAEQLRAALDHPDDPAIYGELPRLVEDTPLLRDDLATLAQDAGKPLDEYLADPANAPTIKAMLPGPVGPTPLDEAVTKAVASGNRAALDTAMEGIDVAASLGRPKPPIGKVSLEQFDQLVGVKPADTGQIAGVADAAEKAYRTATEQLQQAILERKAAFASAMAEVRSGSPVVHPDTGAPIATTNAKKAIALLRRDLRNPAPDGTPQAVASQARADARTALEKVGSRPKPAAPRRTLSAALDGLLRRSGADFSARPDTALVTKPDNAVGRAVLNILGWGRHDRDLTTIQDVLTVLREIENGNAANVGFGPQSLAKAQALGEALVRRAVTQAEEAGVKAGVLSKGAYLSEANPETADVFRRIVNEGGIVTDSSNPWGLQYGIKKRPLKAVATEFEQMRLLSDEAGLPSLAEEIWNGSFQPFQQRLVTAKLRQAYNYVFGPHSNADIVRNVRAEFTRRAVRQGASVEEAGKVWQAWADTVHDSNLPKIMRRGLHGESRAIRGDQNLFASRAGIPNGKLLGIAQDALGESEYRIQNLAWDTLFREASSPVMRALGDAPIPFGKALEAVYGAVTNNQWMRFGYYLFRFGGDFRYHVMNFFEGQMLYAGRSAFRPGETPPGWLGATHDWLHRIAEDPALNTGYPFSVPRAKWAERTFRREQMDASVSTLKELQQREPDIVQSFKDFVQADPELSKTIAAMGDTPESYLQAMHDWYSRVLEQSDPSIAAEVAVAEALQAEPAMQEVYGRVLEANKALWEDVKQTFFGNPNRSRVERALNHYLLYWPISYQLKSARWLLKVLYDRAGGLPTNSYGAYSLDRLIATHNKQLATDPEYGKWLKDNKTLLFAAQMMFPTTWNQSGVSLTPLLRDAFFNRTKNVLEIGPVYTIETFLPNVMGNVYQSLHDVPGMDLAYRALSGRTPPKISGGGGDSVDSAPPPPPDNVFAPAH